MLRRHSYIVWGTITPGAYYLLCGAVLKTVVVSCAAWMVRDSPGPVNFGLLLHDPVTLQLVNILGVVPQFLQDRVGVLELAWGETAYLSWCVGQF